MITPDIKCTTKLMLNQHKRSGLLPEGVLIRGFSLLLVLFLNNIVYGNMILQDTKTVEAENSSEKINAAGTPVVSPDTDIETVNYPQELTHKLEMLNPDNPALYFLTGEDVMDQGDYNLARKLFVFAASLDSHTYGRSSCLALAEIANREGKMPEARRLQGAARLYPGADIQPVINNDAEDNKLRKIAARNISAMLGYYRHGEGAYALKALDFNEETEQLINQYHSSLDMLSDVINRCRNHLRCPECHNEGVVKCPACRGGADPGRCAVCNNHIFILCRTCQGKPGSLISSAELDSMLRKEVALLSGKDASWAAQLELDSDMPGDVIDPTQLAYSFDIDVTRMLFRQGNWYCVEDLQPPETSNSSNEHLPDK